LTHCGFEQVASSDERNSCAATPRGSVVAVAIEPRGVVFLAQIADPVPGEQALDADDDVGPIGREGLEEDFLVGRNGGPAGDLSGVIEDADGEQPGMEVDAGVELVLFDVEVHGDAPVGQVGA
jgi:hypothetical protein